MANCVKCGRQLPAFSFKKICQWCVQHEAAQRGEGGEEAKQTVMPAPWVRRDMSVGLTQVIFGANVAVFLGMVLATSSVTDFPGQDLAHWGANFGPYTLSGEWWRLVTYMFLHGGIMHIAFNMWCLWDLGSLCESLYGRWTFAAIYFITGIGAGLASVGWNPGVLSVGASGAIFGMIGALVASIYLGEFSMPRFALSGTLKSLVVFAGFSLFSGLVGGFFVGIDNAAHIGGLVTGLILGALIARAAPEQDNPARRFAVISVVALALVGAGLGVQHWRGGPLRFGRAVAENGPDVAIARLQAIIRQRPDFVDAHFALGQAYLAKSLYPRAEAEFKRVLELQPKHLGAHIELGMLYLNQKRLPEAKDAFMRALAQNPNSVDAHFGLGLVLAEEGNHQGAIDEYKTATRLDPHASGVNYNLGVSYANLKMYDEAIAAYLREKENGDDPDVENALADAYQAKGMTQQANEAKHKAEQLTGR